MFDEEGHSTSPPCGNLVDGLPHDCQFLEIKVYFHAAGPNCQAGMVTTGEPSIWFPLE